jgi:hypothetical protein
LEFATINYIFSDTIVDDNEMDEIMGYENNLKKGLSDVKKGRYKIIG